MSDKEFMHRIHGKDYHDLCIFLVQRMIVDAGHQLLNGDVFKLKYHFPSSPDIYMAVLEQRHEGSKVISWTQRYVIEVETHLTKANAEKKYNQFEASNTACKLIIINLADFKGEHDSIEWTEKYLAMFMPFEVK
jgi:hypothetical protein